MTPIDRMELFLKYQLTPYDIEVVDLAFLWEDLSKKYFPHSDNTFVVGKNKDPRKSWLFKICHKIIQETKDILPPEERKLYITAQLVILKSHGATHAGPMVLTGERAWKRWKVWEKWYKESFQKKKEITIDDELEFKIKQELNKSVSFIKKNKIVISDLNRNILDGSISPYYVAMNNTLMKSLPPEDWESKLGMSYDAYAQKITPNLIQYLKDLETS